MHLIDFLLFIYFFIWANLISLFNHLIFLHISLSLSLVQVSKNSSLWFHAGWHLKPLFSPIIIQHLHSHTSLSRLVFCVCDHHFISYSHSSSFFIFISSSLTPCIACITIPSFCFYKLHKTLLWNTPSSISISLSLSLTFFSNAQVYFIRWLFQFSAFPFIVCSLSALYLRSYLFFA